MRSVIIVTAFAVVAAKASFIIIAFVENKIAAISVITNPAIGTALFLSFIY